jgi:hypothetical protein
MIRIYFLNNFNNVHNVHLFPFESLKSFEQKKVEYHYLITFQ